MSIFSTRKLYGGALEAFLPERLNSLGDLLPIPDTQEVFSDPENRCSYIIELLDQCSLTDTEAIRTIFQDIIEANQSTSSTITSQNSLNNTSHIVIGEMIVNNNTVYLYLLIKRLYEVNTDLTFYIADPEGLPNPKIMEILEKFSSSFKIIDRNLFG
ncbi:hypothetical protein SteCoe_14012 [Stentor coeruleus]|uniref:Uncharacterized protein n=1 Tax=Stentor coeruleus TaxID=5963 RepID=A0A1R2C728_9CILI|nr:hypothetical protein SteCoe_14012 [Stentor coeruleus]